MQVEQRETQERYFYKINVLSIPELLLQHYSSNQELIRFGSLV